MHEDKLIQLIHRAKNSDPAAFEHLIRMFNRDLYRVASAILMNDEDAADAIQDTILTCWEKIRTLKQPQYFKSWLTRILINKCYRILESRGERASLDEVSERGREDVYNLEFKEALSGLGDKYRLIAVMYYCEGYSTKEIAEMLNLPDATVRTRLMRARDILKDYYI